MTHYCVPNAESEKILDRAFQLVESVPYRVSGRWLFYRMYQEGWYTKKSDCKDKFSKLTSNARHLFYKGWRPDTLADETRTSIPGGGGFVFVQDWLDALSKEKCQLDKWISQPVYLECWYEARAMTDQFRFYTKYITLRPMGGEPSIPYLWQAAQELKLQAEFEKPIIILYFGDLDKKGVAISKRIERDVRTWAGVDFEYKRCGLTPEQVEKYKVPESEKLGQYQWEALEDLVAKEIITSSIDQYLRHDAFVKIEQEESRATDWLNKKLSDLVFEWKEI
jgi:hypothetical protein